MTNVYIPYELFKSVKVIRKGKGEWRKGEFVEVPGTLEKIRAVYMPVSLNQIKNYPQGLLTLEDIDLRTKANLNYGDLVILDNEEFKIVQKTDYTYIADLKFYILRRSSKDD